MLVRLWPPGYFSAHAARGGDPAADRGLGPTGPAGGRGDDDAGCSSGRNWRCTEPARCCSARSACGGSAAAESSDRLKPRAAFDAEAVESCECGGLGDRAHRRLWPARGRRQIRRHGSRHVRVERRADHAAASAVQLWQGGRSQHPRGWVASLIRAGGGPSRRVSDASSGRRIRVPAGGAWGGSPASTLTLRTRRPSRRPGTPATPARCTPAHHGRGSWSRGPRQRRRRTRPRRSCRCCRRSTTT
jgi:hypothetical protein